MSDRPRASQAHESMMRGFTAVPPRPTPRPVSADEPAPAVGEGSEQTRPAKSSRQSPKKRGVPDNTTKYTANLDADTAAEFDGLALAARRKLGRRVDKSEVMKALIRLAADDASLRDQVINQLQP